jgi:hypothetical protein
VSAKTQDVYGALRRGIEERGGSMWYEPEGYGQGGAWIVRLGSRERAFPWDNKAFPGLDDLYIPKVRNPKYWTDYTRTLIPGAIDKLIGRLDQPGGQ